MLLIADRERGPWSVLLNGEGLDLHGELEDVSDALARRMGIQVAFDDGRRWAHAGGIHATLTS